MFITEIILLQLLQLWAFIRFLKTDLCIQILVIFSCNIMFDNVSIKPSNAAKDAHLISTLLASDSFSTTIIRKVVVVLL